MQVNKFQNSPRKWTKFHDQQFSGISKAFCHPLNASLNASILQYLPPTKCFIQKRLNKTALECEEPFSGTKCHWQSFLTYWDLAPLQKRNTIQKNSDVTSYQQPLVTVNFARMLDWTYRSNKKVFYPVSWYMTRKIRTAVSEPDRHVRRSSTKPVTLPRFVHFEEAVQILSIRCRTIQTRCQAKKRSQLYGRGTRKTTCKATLSITLGVLGLISGLSWLFFAGLFYIFLASRLYKWNRPNTSAQRHQVPVNKFAH